jgi:hypothetical protein
MPALFQHRDDNFGGETLGQLRLCSDKLEVIAFGSQKFRFTKKMIEKCLGTCITFQVEK